jgi:hypothetical protein
MQQGGGVREHVFWKNYFFHCAYTRYEAGLSIDEIWADVEDPNRAPVTTTSPVVPPSVSVPVASAGVAGENIEETITFDEDMVNAETSNSEVKHEKSDTLFEPFGDSTVQLSKPPTIRSESDYEMVDDDGTRLLEDSVVNSDIGADTPLEDADYELDELEAEIARELED